MRVCPLCLTKVPAGRILAYSDSLECPECKTPLDIAPGSRYIAIAAGLAAAAEAWGVADHSVRALGWALPIVYAFLAWGLVSPLVLMLVADLRVKPTEAARDVEQASGPAPAHASSHH